MSQLTINIDIETERTIAQAAARDALSVSQWVKKKLLVAAAASSWPPGYVELLGSLDDPTFKAPDELSAELDQQAVFS